jgi:SAM-dependent methyltransferase
MFDGRYVSLDTWLPPPGHVDLQASANALPFGNGTFDVCLATEMLEHDPAPQQSVAEMARVSRHHVLLTTRSEGYPYHSPPDYHRFSLEDMAVLVDEAGLGVVELVDDPECPGVFCLAAKP